MSGACDLARLEAIVDTSGVPEQIEMLLPVGVRPRQLTIRTLLIGMLILAVEGRPAHLRRVHRALTHLSETDKRRLGVIAAWEHGPHELTYRQTEYTFAQVVKTLSKQNPDGAPSQILSEILDGLIEASVKVANVPESSSLAIDWSDLEAWARPPRKDGRCAEAEAAWGHRKTNHPAKAEMFFGYYLQALTTVAEDSGPQVPELARRIQIAGAQHDPPAQIVPVLQRAQKAGIAIGDVLVDSGYSYREAATFAAPMRQAGAALVMDLHPNDRGPKGTHQGATCANGNLYCPATPNTLLELGPLAPAASEDEVTEHDKRCAELHRYKLSPITAQDKDGYRRVACPAAASKIRCPLRKESMILSHEHPTVTGAPEHPPVCCTQKTITVPPTINAKSAQKHDWPSPAHRRSYARRSASERTFASVNDPASNDISRGFCRLMGLAPIALFTATVMIARNLRIADAFAARQADDERRRTCGLPPRTRRRRRRTVHDLQAKANAPPA